MIYKYLLILVITVTFRNAFCAMPLQYEKGDIIINVGTVLFTPMDLKKQEWSISDIQLLQARRSFQNLLPSLHALETSESDYIHSLLQYFHNAYSAIKRETNDSGTDSILTAALSDTIGGYLKLRALPVTKFSFYGGTISKRSAVELFHFYDNLKRLLRTDGKGWKNPNEDILKSIAIKIAPTSRSSTKSIRNPCQQLAYYEITPKGLTVPIPQIKWDPGAYTMFLPLKNQPLVAIDKEKSPIALVNYHDLAKSCIEQKDPSHSRDFENRFQFWLAANVIPHLNDENLYPAFENIFSLISNPKNSMLDKSKARGKSLYDFGCLKLSSENVMIITILLFLEFAWCIPVVIYLLCVKKKNVCPCLKNRKNSNSYTKHTSSSSNPPRTSNIEVETPFPIYVERHSNTACTDSSVTSSRDVFKIITEKATDSNKCSFSQLHFAINKCKSVTVGNEDSEDYCTKKLSEIILTKPICANKNQNESTHLSKTLTSITDQCVDMNLGDVPYNGTSKNYSQSISNKESTISNDVILPIFSKSKIYKRCNKNKKINKEAACSKDKHVAINSNDGTNNSFTEEIVSNKGKLVKDEIVITNTRNELYNNLCDKESHFKKETLLSENKIVIENEKHESDSSHYRESKSNTKMILENNEIVSMESKNQPGISCSRKIILIDEVNVANDEIVTHLTNDKSELQNFSSSQVIMGTFSKNYMNQKSIDCQCQMISSKILSNLITSKPRVVEKKYKKHLTKENYLEIQIERPEAQINVEIANPNLFTRARKGEANITINRPSNQIKLGKVSRSEKKSTVLLKSRKKLSRKMTESTLYEEANKIRTSPDEPSKTDDVNQIKTESHTEIKNTDDIRENSNHIEINKPNETETNEVIENNENDTVSKLNKTVKRRKPSKIPKRSPKEVSHRSPVNSARTENPITKAPTPKTI